MNDGELIRSLRINRGLTQEQLARNISPRSTLASFELNDTHLPVQLFIAYCHRLNISLEEYEFMRENSQLSSKRHCSVLVHRSFAAPYNDEISCELLRNYRQTNDFFYYSLYAQYYLVCGYRARLQDVDPGWYSVDSANAIKEKITTYLETVDTWNRFEVVLFYNCLFVFSEEYIRVKFKRVILKTRAYIDNPNYSKDILNFLLNGIQLAIDRNDPDNYELFHKELLDTSKTYNDFALNLHLCVYDAIMAGRLGVNVTDVVAELKYVLKFCGASELLNFLEQQYK
ncbi:helix-turn-helix domain-containing protein [Lacticaseibacillus jixiensis]|uniref:helix-turn-helix domain-containing protein n=1 Tax=Lacticaseibacillus jixiensis TaxID=3231926 RepID=UPI0036F38188